MTAKAENGINGGVTAASSSAINVKKWRS